MGIFQIRQNFLFLQWGFHIFFYCLLLLLDIQKDLFVFGLLALWYTISYAYLFYVEIKKAPDFNPFQILILSSIQFVGLNGLNMYFRALEGEIFKFGIYTINDILVIGIYFLSLQHLLLYTGFCIVDYYQLKKKEKYNYLTVYERIGHSDNDYLHWAIYTYLVVWILRITNFFLPLASIGSFLNNMAAEGQIIVLLLLVFAKIQRPDDTIIMKLHWGIALLEIILVLGSGMKEMIIQNLMPYVLLLLWQYKAQQIDINFSLLVKLLLLFVVILNVFIYISVFRDIANTRKVEWREISIEEAFSGYIDYILAEGAYKSREKESTNKGLDYLMSRAGSIGCNAWSVNYAQTKKIKPEYLYYCSIGLIPRILWPDKPSLQVGGMMYRLSTGHESNWVGLFKVIFVRYLLALSAVVILH